MLLLPGFPREKANGPGSGSPAVGLWLSGMFLIPQHTDTPASIGNLRNKQNKINFLE